MDIFCNLYPAWRDAGAIVYENNAGYSIISPTPAVPRHLIVAPRRHVEKLSELKPNEAAGLLAAQQNAFNVLVEHYSPARMRDVYERLLENPPVPSARADLEGMLAHPDLEQIPTGFNSGMNVGKSAGQTIEHLHWHLFPRYGTSGSGVVSAMQLLDYKQAR